MNKKRISYGFLFYLVVIVTLHLLPFGTETLDLNKISTGFFRLDHLMHATMFLPWMAVVWIYSGINKPIINRKVAIFWLLAGVVLSAATEFIHYWLPYRAFNVFDMIFNMSGVVCGGVIFWMFLIFRSGRGE